MLYDLARCFIQFFFFNFCLTNVFKPAMFEEI